MTAAGWSDVYRRTFLATTAVMVADLLVGRLPDGPERDRLRTGDEPFERLRGVVNELRRLDSLDGSASILIPATWLAGRLTAALAKTPGSGSDHRALANLAADAAELAGWASFETGEHRVALAWYDRAISAATQAAAPNLLAFAGVERARVLNAGFGETGAALQQLAQIMPENVAPALQARKQAQRALILAHRGDERGSLGAIEAAMGAAAMARPGDGWPAYGWTGRSASMSPVHVQRTHGLVMVALGYADTAEDELSPLLLGAGPDMRRRRSTGSVHTGLAQAAISLGEPDRAAEHILSAHLIFAGTRSRRLAAAEAVVAELRARWGDTKAVRDLNDGLRTDARYRLCETSKHGLRVHLATCRFARRGYARPWPAGEGLQPEDVAKSPLREGYEVCRRCLPA